MKAITTRFFGATNTRGSRIVASDLDGNRITVSYDHALDSVENHRIACRALCIRMDWRGRYAVGGLRAGYVFVPISDVNPDWLAV